MSKPAARPRSDPDAVLLRDDNEGIATLSLNRPDARNSLSEAMLAALTDTFASIAKDRSVRAVIIAGNGPAFCAGHDLKELTRRLAAHRKDADKGRAYFTHIFDTCAAMMQSIARLPQPVIASVGGTATAAGCQLVASCDLVVASEAARFATPGVNIGLFCSAPMVPLSRKVAPGHVMEMLLTGDAIDAERARELGLVNRVVPAGREREEALALARAVAKRSSYIMKVGKEAFYRQLEMDIADAYRFTSKVMVDNMLARDAEEGIGAFVEKRTPKWEDR